MKILFLEDNQTDVDLTLRAIKKQRPEWIVEVAGTLAQAAMMIKKTPVYDLVLADMSLPDGNGLDLLIYIRQQSIPLAIAILTGTGDEETAVASLKAGADDYIIKNEQFPDSLAEILEQALQRFRNHLEQTRHIYKVLYVEHNPSDTDLTRRHFTHYAPQFRLVTVSSAPEALELLPLSPSDPCPFDILLIDYKLPGINALEAIKVIRTERKLDLAIVMVTGQGDEEITVQALRSGVDEYVVKRSNYLYHLPSVLTNAFQYHELKREYEELRIAKERAEESDNLKTAFLANLSHEIRTPVSAIKGFSDLLTEPGIERDEIIKYAAIIDHRTNDLLQIIDDIIDLAKLATRQMKIIPSENTLQSLLTTLEQRFRRQHAPSNNKSFQIQTEPPLDRDSVIISTDFTRVLQVLWNLVDNAWKFTEKGKVEVLCRLNSPVELQFQVRDTGCGILPRQQKFIFEPFRWAENNYLTRDQGGLGMGLSIAKGLVDLLGGKITMESEPGKGSVFSFTIPYPPTEQ